jgi:hypothetical protein
MEMRFLVGVYFIWVRKPRVGDFYLGLKTPVIGG